MALGSVDRPALYVAKRSRRPNGLPLQRVTVEADAFNALNHDVMGVRQQVCRAQCVLWAVIDVRLQVVFPLHCSSALHTSNCGKLLSFLVGCGDTGLYRPSCRAMHQRYYTSHGATALDAHKQHHHPSA